MWGLVAALLHVGSGSATAQMLPDLWVLADPAVVAPYDVLAIRVRVSGVTGPYDVRIDARPIGGPASVPLLPTDSTCTVQEVFHTACFTIPGNARSGQRTLPITVTDRLGRVVTTTVAVGIALQSDDDLDTLPGAWESRFGLDPRSSLGDNGAFGDPDGDGVSNRDEYLRGTHPRGRYTRYLAEGATVSFFSTRLAVANVASDDAKTLVRFLPKVGAPVSYALTIVPFGRATVDARTVLGSVGAEFSMVVESDLPVVAERLMTWDHTGYGSHGEMGTARPSETWYLAEGATHSGFELFYLLQNPSTVPAHVRVTYLLPDGRAPIAQDITVAANARENIWVNTVNGLKDVEVSAVIQSTNHVPIIVERSLYKTIGSDYWSAGHDSLGVTAPSDHWFFAEGATGTMFDLFLLVANPNTDPGTVDVDYLLEDGSIVSKAYDVAPQSRRTVWVDYEDERLAAVPISMVVTGRNGLPIIAERSMWWPGPTPTDWREGHNSPGATRTARVWGLAEGEVRDNPVVDTFILLANTSPFPGTAKVTLLGVDYYSAQRTVIMPAQSRLTLDVRVNFTGVVGKKFGAIVESVAPMGVTPADIVVERAMYSSDGREPSFLPYWPAGTNVVGAPIFESSDYWLTLSSTIGEPVGRGYPRFFRKDDGEFTASQDGDGYVAIGFRGLGTYWELDFTGQRGRPLEPGVYEGATRFGSTNPFRPGLQIIGESSACNSIQGRFTVHDVVYSTGGDVIRFHADFEQHCEGMAPALTGTVRYGY